jgi:hypothetical protein
MIGDVSEAKAVEAAMRNARRRRNAAARLLLAHKSTHEEFLAPEQTQQLRLNAGWQ